MANVEQNKANITREVSFPQFSLSRREDDVIVLSTPDSAWITLKEARSYATAMHEFTGGIPHLLLLIPGRHASLDKQARSFLASEESWRDIIAMAIVTMGQAQKMIGNLFLTIDRPAKPVMLFDSADEAISWLKKQNVD